MDSLRLSDVAIHASQQHAWTPHWSQSQHRNPLPWPEREQTPVIIEFTLAVDYAAIAADPGARSNFTRDIVGEFTNITDVEPLRFLVVAVREGGTGYGSGASFRQSRPTPENSWGS